MQQISISLLDLVLCSATAMQTQTQAPNQPGPRAQEAPALQPPFDPQALMPKQGGAISLVTIGLRCSSGGAGACTDPPR
jgi:hypothetical protein